MRPYGKNRTPPGAPTIEELRRAARGAGAKQFDPGVPCAHGHVSPRWTASSQCVACLKERRPLYNVDADRLRARRHRADARRSTSENRRQQRLGWYRANRSRIDEQHRVWAAAHPDAVRRNANARGERWRRRNLDKDAAASARRRAKLRSVAGGDRAAHAAVYRLARAEGHIRCYWCGKRTSREDRHVDHIVPIARGGADTAENLCVSCVGCNQRKGALLPYEFAGQAELVFQ